MSYPAKVIRFARSLDEDGRTITEIQAAVKKHTGREPHTNTVKRWVDEEYRLLSNDRQRRRDFRNIDRSAETLEQHVYKRVLQLREVGVSWPQASRVIALDFGLEICPDLLRYRVKAGQPKGLLARAKKKAAA